MNPAQRSRMLTAGGVAPVLEPGPFREKPGDSSRWRITAFQVLPRLLSISQRHLQFAVERRPIFSGRGSGNVGTIYGSGADF